MNWCDERYVRLYTRDTADFLALSFEAQGLLSLLLRKFDRAGVLELGKHGKRAVAIAIGHASRWETLEPALDELLADGCVVLDGNRLVMPNFVDAQEAVQSDRLRQAESRARRRELTHNDVTNRDSESRNVTKSHAVSQPVTRGHAVSQDVTPSVPSVPSLPNQTHVASLIPLEPRWTPDFEALYRLYPLKKGKDKGLLQCKRQIRTPADYEDLHKAIANYAAEVQGKDPQYTKHFSTFMGCWRDYIAPVEKPAERTWLDKLDYTGRYPA